MNFCNPIYLLTKTSTLPEGNKEVCNIKSRISALHKDICNISYNWLAVNTFFTSEVAASSIACYNPRIMLPFDARVCNITFGRQTTTFRPLKDLYPHGEQAATLDELHMLSRQSNTSTTDLQRSTYPIWFRVMGKDLEDKEEQGLIYLFQPTYTEEIGLMARRPSHSNFLIPATAKESHMLPIVKIGVQDGNPHIHVNDTARLPLHLYIDTPPNPRGKITIKSGGFHTVQSRDHQRDKIIYLTGPDPKIVNIRIGEIQTVIASLLFYPSLEKDISSESFNAAINPLALRQISRL